VTQAVKKSGKMLLTILDCRECGIAEHQVETVARRDRYGFICSRDAAESALRAV
jgi:hypothetical protein